MKETFSLDIQFETGLLWQDTQHMQWVALLDKLETARKEKLEDALFNQAISFLVMYVNHHFSLEEIYMQQFDYPEKRFHVEEHRLYILRLKDFRDKNKEFSEQACIKIIESMKEWVFSHIMENDKKLGTFIQKAEQKKRSADR